MMRIFSQAVVLATSVAVAAAITAGSAGAANAATTGPVSQHASVRAAAQIRPGKIQLTRAELADWRRATATVAGRAKIVADLQKSFAGIAHVSTGASLQATASAPGRARPDLSVGRTGDHVWIIASYADIADGAIYSGVLACGAYLPELFDFCDEIGEILADWAQGWGRASNHGVWAAIYWLPPHWSGGRW